MWQKMDFDAYGWYVLGGIVLATIISWIVGKYKKVECAGCGKKIRNKDVWLCQECKDPAKYCEQCGDTHLKECLDCEYLYCDKHIKKHDCEEYADEEESGPEVYSSDNSICLLNVEDISTQNKVANRVANLISDGYKIKTSYGNESIKECIVFQKVKE